MKKAIDTLQQAFPENPGPASSSDARGQTWPTARRATQRNTVNMHRPQFASVGVRALMGHHREGSFVLRHGWVALVGCGELFGGLLRGADAGRAVRGRRRRRGRRHDSAAVPHHPTFTAAHLAATWAPRAPVWKARGPPSAAIAADRGRRASASPREVDLLAARHRLLRRGPANRRRAPRPNPRRSPAPIDAPPCPPPDQVRNDGACSPFVSLVPVRREQNPRVRRRLRGDDAIASPRSGAAEVYGIACPDAGRGTPRLMDGGPGVSDSGLFDSRRSGERSARVDLLRRPVLRQTRRSIRPPTRARNPSSRETMRRKNDPRALACDRRWMRRGRRHPRRPWGRRHAWSRVRRGYYGAMSLEPPPPTQGHRPPTARPRRRLPPKHARPTGVRGGHAAFRVSVMGDELPFVEYPLPIGNGGLRQRALGADGNVWLAASPPHVGKLASSGAIAMSSRSAAPRRRSA